ncbi:MAG: cobalt ECF transporter T component CbiQ [Nitrospirae bacterium CG_4_9_14_3_um_filter_53_35]|nr:MAG: cobalt ECF transporter T component CbiQ [Nitrospirae bacterium CG2_30_53_67]PIS38244.1 MAG: cobalt ECF transporter T component CbiQ [Nitrospirae bacterium CG08_land_8_20_14_0_20_52_24]PIV83996.1 MAG: cobalt ECF transporter T component CbiQ [Nitrospirae bacterium CG17_big_fil_post_rev_8_21_14_2_50_50_9]PIW84902.1 MAG: cobalt ECF transporter T component CbiQ [Nitrospirae bacterium CG_4_8_14_3_um_filter_50_41]PIX86852.1 MAG: cobalt ECF transporter T component CbiQ [Nitrospirae bacterium CG
MELFSEYFKKEQLLSKVDARLKLIIALTLLGMILSYKGFTLPLLVTALCLLFCLKMRIPLKIFALRFSQPLFIISVLLILKVFFSGEGILFSINIFGIKVVGHKDGFMEGLMIGSRIIGAVSVVAVMGFSTPFTEFMAGLSWLRVPKGFIEILMFAYRYIFVLLEDAMVIYNAQKNRLGYSNIRRGLSSFGTLSGSLILKAFDHSRNITVSMIQRGYDGNIPMLRHKPFKSSEIIVSLLFIIAMGVVWKI